MDLVLVGDIGGTNSRFNLYSIERLTHNYDLVLEDTFKTNDYDSLKSIIKEFLKSFKVEDDAMYYACIGMAGLVHNNEFEGASNINWEAFKGSDFLKENWF